MENNDFYRRVDIHHGDHEDHEGFQEGNAVCYWEFANVMRTLAYRREIDGAMAREIYDLHVEAPLEHAEPDQRQVLDVALEYGATAYDAVYISLCLARDIPLITAEKSTTLWVTKLGERIEVVR